MIQSCYDRFKPTMDGSQKRCIWKSKETSDTPRSPKAIADKETRCSIRSYHEHGYIGDIVVVQTSRHTTLDQDAVTLLEQASPVPLEHQLGQSHVIVYIPIGHRLE